MQVLAVGLAVLISALDYVWHDRRKRTFKKGRNLLFLFSALFLVGSIITTIHDDYDNNQKEEHLRTQLNKVQEQNDGLQKGVAVLSDKSSHILTEQRNNFISDLNDQRRIGLGTAKKIEEATSLLNSGISDSITKQKDLLEQQQTTLNNLTSGNSYCYVTAGNLDEDYMMLALVHKGDYPIYDAVINITDQDTRKPLANLEGRALMEAFEQNAQVFHIGTVVPNLVREVTRIELKGAIRKKYRISIFTRYRKFGQSLELIKVGRAWNIAYKVSEEATVVKDGYKAPPKLLEEYP